MSKIKPFRGLRPTPQNASKVASPPYDVLNSAEARELTRDNPLSFLHVVKPEIDLPVDMDVHSDEVYAKGAENLAAFQSNGVMSRDEKPCFYLYRQTMKIGETMHSQTGLVVGASVDEYENNLIKKHELTRADKEADRTRHVDTQNANAGPVFLTYKADDAINKLINSEMDAQPVNDFIANDGIGHTVWVIDDDDKIAAFVSAFERLPHSYVADGHHRSASASAVGKKRKAANPNHTGDENYNSFLAVLFPHDQLYIMDYNRVVFDLAGFSEAEYLAKIQEKFDCAPTDTASPGAPTQFGMYLGGKWYRLTAREGTFDPTDPVGSLDVAILQENLLAPILGIGDPRTDKRIDFVGGIRGSRELERRVNEGAAVAFAMYATSIEQLMTIADAGAIMPPKSTWFEPKLRSGLIVRLYDQ